VSTVTNPSHVATEVAILKPPTDVRFRGLPFTTQLTIIKWYEGVVTGIIQHNAPLRVVFQVRTDDSSIVPGSPEPLYRQVGQYQVYTGAWKPDTRIPSERELCQQFGLSRTTVRQALDDAVGEGLLYKIQGKGTFVSPQRRVNQQLFQITTFTDTLKARGLVPGLEIIELCLEPVDFQMAKLLDVSINAEVIRLDSLGLGNDEPMAHYSSYFPRDIVDVDIEKLRAMLAEQDEQYFVIELYARQNGLTELLAEQKLEATRADQVVADRLGVPVGTPIFNITSLVTSPDGRPVEFRIASYRGDKYSFNVQRSYHFDLQ